MKRTFALFAFLGCDGRAGSRRTRSRPKDNTPPPGFTALFNGKDLTNWQGLVELPQRKKLSPEDLAKKQKEANEKYLPHWTVEDGILIYDGKGQSLQTAKDYGNFELYVDWKIPPKGDSGIYLRGQPQVQIWDSDTLSGRLAEDKGKGSGGLWNNPKNSPGPEAAQECRQTDRRVEHVPHHHEGRQRDGLSSTARRSSMTRRWRITGRRASRCRPRGRSSCSTTATSCGSRTSI